MELQIRQISSLEKVRANDDLNQRQVHERTVLAGERLSYQICIKSPQSILVDVSVESELLDNIRLYQVREVPMDCPVTEEDVPMEGYLTLEPGFMPDLLVPLEQSDFHVGIKGNGRAIWVRADIPRDMEPGVYSIHVKLNFRPRKGFGAGESCDQTMTVRVLPAALGEQKLIYTRWFHTDCIASVHDVPIFSEEHWDLIEKYIAAAVDMGINMILVPIHTPPLDTPIGLTRPCVQLVDIEKKDGRYVFSFDKFHRFIGLCKKHGIRYYEMAHMFSQWGAKCTPNIKVKQNGKTEYMFGWHVSATDPSYVDFLKQYISAVSTELVREGIDGNAYFHVSDEPSIDNLDTYKATSDILRSLIGESKTIDALSNYDFYEKGLVECPVTRVEHIHEFLKHPVKNQWTYCCCGPQRVFPNHFIAMSSARARVLGFLLYRYDIKGFLQWGFNFYYASAGSLYTIDPYLTTSGDRTWPSGDPFIVYPGRHCVYPSIRGEVFYEAIQDIDICCVLESFVGRKQVVAMIDEAAGRTLRFDDYPQEGAFLEDLRCKMEEEIAKHLI